MKVIQFCNNVFFFLFWTLGSVTNWAQSQSFLFFFSIYVCVYYSIFFRAWSFSVPIYFVLLMPNYTMLLRNKYVKHWLEIASKILILYLCHNKQLWGLNKRFNFLWRRSNHWDGWWEKRVDCLMGFVLFSSNLITLDFVRRVCCKTLFSS